jgi:hypothetical protein
MKTPLLGPAALAAIVALSATAAPRPAHPQDASPRSRQKLAVEGTFIRIGFDEEGWVTMGYRTANSSVGEEWLLLEVGVTVQKGVEDYTLERSDIALVTPGPKVVPLATQAEYQKAGHLRPLNARANIARDSINYFPPSARNACAMDFFGNPGGGGPSRLARDQVELSSDRACAGRLYFHVPDGVQLGLHNLVVRFAETTIRVPFQIMTEAEAKAFEKRWKEARKRAKEAEGR